LLENALRDFPHLGIEWHGKLGTAVTIRLLLLFTLGLGMDPLHLGNNPLALLTALPHRVPVLAAVVGALGHDLQHELGRVLLWAAVPRAVSLKVIEKRPGVLANITKVDRSPALGQKEQTVELLEEDGVGLMNSTEHSLTRIRQLAKEHADCPGALRIETTGRLIEEEEQFRLGDKLDADGEEFALLDVEALTGNADHGVGVLFHAEHLDDLLNELKLFLLANCLGPTQHGTETETLPDCSCVKVKI
jgi:hypothetical protein